ncbi:Olfactory receptor 5D13 [Heterocephalus glaber]|uniref:Olfactory receptor 5D13 n=1 Tax=Heterocephalus glaber TaxID=10181 RepID=G5B4J7_HETGA|nr:Olfactory receptor 5D13 [Heterocephalus glaber]
MSVLLGVVTQSQELRCETNNMVMDIVSVMAYDRFVAVGKPLLYTVAMSPKLCALLVAGTYMWGALCSLKIMYSLVQLSYCESNITNHFASTCPLDPYITQMLSFIIVVFDEVSSLMIILTSYALISITVMKMTSATGHWKTFSTCASHLTAITIFHDTILLLFCAPNATTSWVIVKVASVFYMVVIPMLNPLIYSLRKKDVKEALRKFIFIKSLCHVT